MLKTLYAEDLKSMPCRLLGCTRGHDGPNYLHPKCHLASGTITAFVNGKLLIECYECGLPVAWVAVQSKEEAS